MCVYVYVCVCVCVCKHYKFTWHSTKYNFMCDTAAEVLQLKLDKKKSNMK